MCHIMYIFSGILLQFVRKKRDFEDTAEETKAEESSFKVDTDDDTRDTTDTFDLDQLKKALASGDSSQLLRTLSKSQSFSSAK